MQTSNIESMSTGELVENLTSFNAAYRAGEPLISDDEYDHVWLAELRSRKPDHPFLNTVEPEVISGRKHRHRSPMLSTDKAYTDEAAQTWLDRGLKAAEKLGIDPANLEVSVTAKLDGIAAFDDGEVLATRGDGHDGQVITRAFERGVVAVGGRGGGAGEIVIDQAFYEREIEQQFDMKSPRNYVAGLIGADTLKPHHKDALERKMVRFVPFSTLAQTIVTVENFVGMREQLLNLVPGAEPYLTDGVVATLRVANNLDQTKALHDALGATSHHHRAVIALKRNAGAKMAKVTGHTLQTGRTGRITPVVQIEPTELAGATVTNVTAHTAAMLQRRAIGVGALIEVVRSGEVIPFINKVLLTSGELPDLKHCPSCGAETEWDNDYLVCPNTELCPAQAARSMEHFFKITNILGFGPSVCETLCEAGVTDPVAVLQMDQQAFEEAGISSGIANNLVEAIVNRKREPLRSNMLLAALGIRHCGRGDSRKILEHVRINEVLMLTVADIEDIRGFARHTATEIVKGIYRNRVRINALLGLGFNIDHVPLVAEREAAQEAAQAAGSAIAGKKLVFTGKSVMPRPQMKAQAESLGATVQSSVSGSTDILVCGDGVGKAKTSKAEKHGVTVMAEADYMQLIGANQ